MLPVGLDCCRAVEALVAEEWPSSLDELELDIGLRLPALVLKCLTAAEVDTPAAGW